MSKLLYEQKRFAFAVSELIAQAYLMGYEVTLGDAYRDPHVRYGSKSSRHRVRLAIDLNLFKDGKYLRTTEDHRPLGEWWEKTQGGIWGGHFDDGNHYEWPLPKG